MRAFASVLVAAAILSAAGPQPFLSWFAEAALILIAGATLVATYPKFQFTGITYVVFLSFALTVLLGAHYTYARVPIGEWAKGAFDLQRNHFDRFGHFMQGASPALIFRELLIRSAPFRRGKGLFWVVAGLCLSVAAVFELLEWQYALVKGGGDDLGAQGDQWDAQADMLMALIGAVASQKMFGAWQDWQLGHESTVELRHGVYAEQLQRPDHVAAQNVDRAFNSRPTRRA